MILAPILAKPSGLKSQQQWLYINGVDDIRQAFDQPATTKILLEARQQTKICTLE